MISRYETNKKNKSKKSKAVVKEQKDFQKQCEKVFWIAKKDIGKMIRQDRDKDAFRNDMQFLKDQKTKRLMTMSSKDLVYEKLASKRAERQAKYDQFLAKKQSEGTIDFEGEIEFTSGGSDSSMDSVISSASDCFNLPGPSTEVHSENADIQSGNQVVLSKTFAKELALTAVQRNMSANTLMHICTDVVTRAGGDIADFSLSHSTLQRAKKKAVTEEANKHKDEVRKCIQDAKYPIIGHFDGKILQDITDGTKSKKDRFAVLINADGELKLLGVPAMERGTAESQLEALLTTFEEYDVTDKVMGICFDTTATNTGRKGGTNIRFSKHQGSILLELACRRHVYELHIKHFNSELSTGKTLGPENQLFKKFQANWNDIKDIIDTDKYVRFDVAAVKGTFLERQVTETIDFCQSALDNSTFPRGDYQELLKLTLIYLNEDCSFTINAPGNISHARFMAKAIYYLKMMILKDQLTFSITTGQSKEISRMAEFVAIFYSVWFLKSALSSSAPYQDVKSYWQMVQYKKHIESKPMISERQIDAIENIQMSMKRHTWYLDETLVPFAFADHEVPEIEKAAMAKKLFSLPVPDTFQHTDRTDIMDQLDFANDKLPSLEILIGQNSWFIFKLLNIIGEDDKTWLNCPPSFWKYVDQFKIFSDFVSKVQVVNDSSERAVKLVSDYINHVHKEDDRQELLVAIQRRRDQVKGATSKSALQVAYTEIGKERGK